MASITLPNSSCLVVKTKTANNPRATLARRNPHSVGPTTFVFWNSGNPLHPMEADRLINGLRTAILRLTLSEKDRKDPSNLTAAIKYWKGRRVVFHSWRHYFAARMADRLEKRKVMLATGHATSAVFDAYADHATEEVLQEVEKAQEEAFGTLLKFPARRKGAST